MEISESAIEAEDGCCPECGSVVTAPSQFMDDDPDFNDELDEYSDPDEDDEFMDEGGYEDEEDLNDEDFDEDFDELSEDQY